MFRSLGNHPLKQDAVLMKETHNQSEFADEMLVNLIEVFRKIGQMPEELQRKRTEEVLHTAMHNMLQKEEGLAQFDAVFSSAPMGLFFCDKSLCFIRLNQSLGVMIGLPAEAQIGKHFREIMPDIQGMDELIPALEHVITTGDPLLNFETPTIMSARPGERRFWTINFFPVRIGEEVIGLGATVLDITDRKEVEQQLEYQANYDALTGLPNRVLMTDRLSQTLIYANRSRRIVAVLLLDLDRFKVINESLGHSEGDELLRMVAERLNGCVRPGDTVSRLGGDEFMLILAEIAEVNDIGLVTKRIRDRMAEPFSLAGHQLRVTASIGISLYPRDGCSVSALVRNADLAMYRAKEKGGDTFCFFAPEMNLRIQGALELEADLRLALELREFLLHFQPVVEIATGRIVGCEALVRWHNPRRGMVAPGDFIPLAEETGLIVPLGAWVLREACSQAKAWQNEGLPPIKVAVNFSARQFRQIDLIDEVQAALAEANLAPGMLELELTESMIMHDPDGAAETMHQLKKLGVGLSLDDFGTGYSSLNYLRRFPVDYLKIDRSFITDVASDPSGAAVATSIVAIAHRLGIGAVAEGVETWGQLDFLANCGCNAFQGFLFSKPLPPKEFACLLYEGRSLVRD
jgi:diguanylate cyclase (GGDEF)-like protein/PAS domain S-box-containing protein